MGFLEIWSMKTLFMTTKKMLGDPFLQFISALASEVKRIGKILPN